MPETYTASGATTDRNLIIGASGEIKIRAANPTSGTGTTNTLSLWSDGPAGVLGDSGVSQTFDGGGNIDSITLTTARSKSFKC